MRRGLSFVLLAGMVGASCLAQQPADEALISPARAVPRGKAPSMKAKLVKDTPDEKVYSVVFYKGDEVLSGLTDFAIAHQVADAHFTGIGAVSGVTVGWLDLSKKAYHPLPVTQQVEVLSLTGDIARFNGVPVVHMHAVFGKSDGSTVGGHVFALNVNPTVEIFLTVNTVPLEKRPDEASGIKVIDPGR